MVQIQNDVLGDVATIIATTTGVDAAQVTPEKSFADLDIDSMTMLEAVVALEDRFGLLIPDDQWSQFATVGDLVAHQERAGVVARAAAPRPPPSTT